MIIGIGGISNAGKSKLADNIKTHYSDKTVKILCQDNFAIPTLDIPRINDHTNWEIPDSIDFDRFYEKILTEANQYDIVIDEGLFVFYEERLNRLYNKMIYMSISEETFIERKKKDLRWGEEPEWYIKHIWESHHLFFEKISKRKEAFQLSGENPVDMETVFGYLDR